MKQCKTCNEVKDFSEFNNRKANSDGYNSHCKVCCAIFRKRNYNPETRQKWYELNKESELAKGKIWRDNNKEHLAEINAIWYKKTKSENCEKYLLKYAKSRAKQKI